MTTRNRTSSPLVARVGSRLEPFAPYAFAFLKVVVGTAFVAHYVARYLRVMYIADGPARGIEAYRLTFDYFRLFTLHQFAPLPLWIWAGLLKLWPNIYFTGTAMNIVAGAVATAFLYLLGKRLGGPWAGAVTALLFTFSPVHHNLTVSMGMAESSFYAWLVAGVFFAARGEVGKRGPAAAGFCFAAAALCRYEGTLFLILYAGYRLLRRRPHAAIDWLWWALPLALAGLFLGHKAFLPHHRGLWPALQGVNADTARVLVHPYWYRRLGYGFYRLLFDGRAAAAFGLVGAVLVFRQRWRTADRMLIWSSWAVIFVALTVIAVAVGLGFCPERYFATPLMLLFPFAGFAAVVLARAATTSGRTIAVAAALILGAVITAGWDAAIAEPGYGFRGPAFTRPTFTAETALTLRRLWRAGALGPDELVLIEKGPRLNLEYALRSFSDYPLNFQREWKLNLAKRLPRLVPYMRRNDFRIAVLFSEENRNTLKPYYAKIRRDAVIFENPGHTIVVLKDRWRETPDFTSKVRPDLSSVYGEPGDN